MLQSQRITDRDSNQVDQLSDSKTQQTVTNNNIGRDNQIARGMEWLREWVVKVFENNDDI